MLYGKKFGVMIPQGAFIVILCAIASFVQAQAAELPLFKAVYSLHTRGLEAGEATISLRQPEDNQYVYLSESKTVGMVSWFRDDRIKESSAFMFHNGSIRSLGYEYLHTNGSKTKRHIQVAFDWENKIGTGTKNEAVHAYELPEVVFDRMNFQLGLMQDLAAGKRENLIYWIADDDERKQYELIFEGEERIETEIGEFDTLRFRRESEHKGDKKRITRMWFASALQYLPVRMEHKEKKDTIRMYIQQVDGVTVGTP